jgi:hypothetical protein
MQTRPPKVIPEPNSPIVAWQWFRSRPKLLQVGVVGGASSLLVLVILTAASSMQPKATSVDPAVSALGQSRSNFQQKSQQIKNELTAIDFDSKEAMGIIQRAVESEAIALNERTKEVTRTTHKHEAVVKNGSLQTTQEWAEAAASGTGLVISWYSYSEKKWKSQPVSPELSTAIAGLRTWSILTSYDENYKRTELVPITQDLWNQGIEWRRSLADYLEKQGASPVAEELRGSHVPKQLQDPVYPQ